MSKDYLDKWEERQKQNTEIIEQQQTKTKKMKEECIKEILKATKNQVKGFDNSRLIKAILEKFEIEVRLDQCEKDEEMVMNKLNQNKEHEHRRNITYW